jgi:hypothetical protein
MDATSEPSVECRFVEALSGLLTAKMEQEGTTYDQVSKSLGLSKNYVFRARQGATDARYLMGVPASLLKLMDYVDLGPADLACHHGRPGDIEVEILHDPRLGATDRTTLVAIVRAFYRGSRDAPRSPGASAGLEPWQSVTP